MHIIQPPLLSFNDFFKLDHSDLSKIRGECQGHEEPVLQIEFKDRRSGERTMVDTGKAEQAVKARMTPV